MRLLNHSIVVVAEAHNPSILNPDFLARKRIVQELWGWQVGEPVVCTPPLAQIPYRNGVTLTCDPSKLQVIDAGQRIDPLTSKVAEIAKAYVTILPHVPYASVGVNFAAALLVDDPERLLVSRFLKEGPWNQGSSQVKSIGLRLLYPLEGGRIRISLDAGEVEDAASGTLGRQRAVIVDGNYHHECLGADRAEDIKTFLGSVTEYWDQFSKHAAILVQGE